MAKVEIKTTPERLSSLVVGKKIFRSAFDYEVTPEDLELARKEFGETEELRSASLRTLKEMLSKEKVKYRTDDAYLLRFLRCRKFKCKEAYQMLIGFHSLRRNYPEIFSTLPKKIALEAFMDNVITYLPYRDEEGSLVFLERFGNWNPNELSVYELFTLFQPVGDILSKNACIQIHKIIGILDLRGIGLSHASVVLRPSILMFWLKAWQDLYPWRIKRLIIIHNSHFVQVAFNNSIRHLLKKKMADRIVLIDSDVTQLHQYVDPVLLPKEYGGTLKNIEWTKEHIMKNLLFAEHELSLRQTLEL